MLVASRVDARAPRSSFDEDGCHDGGDTFSLDSLDDERGDAMLVLSRQMENESSSPRACDRNPNAEGFITGWGVGCNLGEYMVETLKGLAEYDNDDETLTISSSVMLGLELTDLNESAEDETLFISSPNPTFDLSTC